jgi:hypothetical protein
MVMSVPPVPPCLIARDQGQQAKASAGEQVGILVVGVTGDQIDDRLAGLLRGERLAQLLEVLLLGLASASRVRPDRRPTEAGQRRDPRQHRGEGDAQPGAVRLVLGVGGDEALGGLGAGVPAAER